MSRLARTVPAALAALLLAAHFLRAQQPLLTIAALALVPLAFVTHHATRVVVRVCLAAGVIEWALTAWAIAQQRIEAGRPYGRMLLILGGVAAFTALAAWLVPRRSAETPTDPGPDRPAKEATR